jgi:hypothetical protein
MATPDYRPDFYDRDGDLLRCRVDDTLIPFDGTSGRDPAYLDAHVGEVFGCPGCGLGSRIPSLDEAEWPNRKDEGDPIDGVPMTDRVMQGRP